MAHLLDYTAQRRGWETAMLAHFLGLAYIFLLIILANRDDRRRASMPMADMATFGLTHFQPLWDGVGAIVRRLNPGETPAFDRLKPVHRVAALLMILQAVLVFWTLALDGQPEGRDLLPADETGALLHVSISAALNVTLALLGVGWLTRRDLSAILGRLGLRLPTPKDWLAGLVTAVLLYTSAHVATAIWASAVSPVTFEAQTRTARFIFETLSGSLVASLLFACLTGISEEILYRGALQPVFGILLSSLFFTLIHVQYAFTPAALILFLVSLGFALLRKRYSTSAAIIAHASYNFLPFLLFALART